jgi:hypothetical protein
MPNVFDYQFNVGGNFTAAMDGMAENNYRIQKKWVTPSPKSNPHIKSECLRYHTGLSICITFTTFIMKNFHS